MSTAQKQLLIDNIVGAMKTLPRAIQERQIAHFTQADPAYGAARMSPRGWVCRRRKSDSIIR